mmetsp:Transcript_35743/g.79544  ORF Transcript_35743/g.79544 Transcript_35743/m.79544 type:complete len:102 (-) Transcript_35743:310-615(-)
MCSHVTTSVMSCYKLQVVCFVMELYAIVLTKQVREIHLFGRQLTSTPIVAMRVVKWLWQMFVVAVVVVVVVVVMCSALALYGRTSVLQRTYHHVHLCHDGC